MLSKWNCKECKKWKKCKEFPSLTEIEKRIKCPKSECPKCPESNCPSLDEIKNQIQCPDCPSLQQITTELSSMLPLPIEKDTQVASSCDDPLIDSKLSCEKVVDKGGLRECRWLLPLPKNSKVLQNMKKKIDKRDTSQIQRLEKVLAKPEAHQDLGCEKLPGFLKQGATNMQTPDEEKKRITDEAAANPPSARQV